MFTDIYSVTRLDTLTFTKIKPVTLSAEPCLYNSKWWCNIIHIMHTLLGLFIFLLQEGGCG